MAIVEIEGAELEERYQVECDGCGELSGQGEGMVNLAVYAAAIRLGWFTTAIKDGHVLHCCGCDSSVAISEAEDPTETWSF